MIEEYRKASAEWMGCRLDDNGYRCFKTKAGEWIPSEYWHPDTDLNQMGMIEDKLDKMSCILYYDNEDFHTWTIRPMIKGRPKFTAYDKSKPIAFMKAWTEYIKS